jgi:hypothetical protein
MDYLIDFCWLFLYSIKIRYFIENKLFDSIWL